MGKIKESILEKSKEIYSQMEAVKDLEVILFTIMDNFSSVFPFARITCPEFFISKRSNKKYLYCIKKSKRDIQEKSLFKG